MRNVPRHHHGFEILLATLLSLSLVQPRAYAAAPAGAPADSTRRVLSGELARPQRPTEAARGRRIGLVSGTIGGGVFGVLLGLLINAFDESGDKINGGQWALVIGGSALTGAATGAVLGTIYGSMVPKEGGAPRQPSDPLIGSVGLQLVGLRGGSGQESGAGGRLLLLAHRGASFRIGTEFAGIDRKQLLVQLGLTARYVHTSGGYLVTTAGFDRQRFLSVIGLSIGAGFEFPGHGAPSAWTAEARYNFTPQRYTDPTPYGFLTLGVGRRWGW